MFWGITAVQDFWETFRNAFKFLQFPYRLFGVATVLLVMALAMWLYEMKLGEKILLGVLAVVLVINIDYAYQYMKPRTNDLMDLGYTVLHEEIAGLGAGEEWLPIQTTRDYLTVPLVATTAEGKSAEGEKIGNQFVFWANKEELYYDVPFVWYKGFKAYTETGCELRIEQVPETGLVRVYMDNLSDTETASAENDEKVIVQYHGTILQVISYWITLIGACGCIAYYLWEHKRLKQRI